MKNFILAIVFGLVLLIPGNAQSIDQSRITVTGEGVLFVVPDRADLYFGIQTEGEEVAQVKRDNDHLVVQMLGMLGDLGVSKEDIQTRRLNLHKAYHPKADKKTYRATQNFVVHIKDLDQYNTITEALLRSGVNQIERVTFGHSDIKRFEDQAREAAVGDAMGKIQRYSKALGRKPGTLVILEEMDGQAPLPVYRMAMAEADNSGGNAMAPGEIKVQSRVRVVQGLQ